MTETLAQAYVLQAASLLKVPLTADDLHGVAASFLHLAKTAELLAEISCPPELESAPVFEP